MADVQSTTTLRAASPKAYAVVDGEGIVQNSGIAENGLLPAIGDDTHKIHETDRVMRVGDKFRGRNAAPEAPVSEPFVPMTETTVTPPEQTVAHTDVANEARDERHTGLATELVHDGVTAVAPDGKAKTRMQEARQKAEDDAARAARGRPR